MKVSLLAHACLVSSSSRTSAWVNSVTASFKAGPAISRTRPCWFSTSTAALSILVLSPVLVASHSCVSPADSPRRPRDVGLGSGQTFVIQAGARRSCWPSNHLTPQHRRSREDPRLRQRPPQSKCCCDRMRQPRPKYGAVGAAARVGTRLVRRVAACASIMLRRC
jgi:hypothetical protein